MNGLTIKGSSISDYIREVNTFPMLSHDEENMLMTNFSNGDKSAGKIVVESHLRLVVHVALEMKKYHNNLADLISEGNVGLLKALQKFSLTKNVRFSVYALLWIKASIQDFILKSISLVRVGTTATQKRIIFGISKVKRALKIIDNKGFEKNINLVAEALGASVKDVREFSSYIASSDGSLNASISDDSDAEMIDIVPSEIATPEEIYLSNESKTQKQQMLNAAMSKLTDREKDIIMKRFLKSSKLAELSSEYGVSVERIRQIESSALRKMKDFAQSLNSNTNFITTNA